MRNWEGDNYDNIGEKAGAFYEKNQANNTLKYSVTNTIMWFYRPQKISSSNVSHSAVPLHKADVEMHSPDEHLNSSDPHGAVIR